jgi:hypothetical protein
MKSGVILTMFFSTATKLLASSIISLSATIPLLRERFGKLAITVGRARGNSVRFWRWASRRSVSRATDGNLITADLTDEAHDEPAVLGDSLAGLWG